jgi:exopolyphosphatase/guanosine-5'-triphosphate,3'-diphosphate pyrophosphatase
LLIADVDAGGALVDRVRRMEVVRLGQGIDRTGVIAPDAMERTLAMTREYAALCREHGVTAVRFVATSASRDARNAGVFVEGVRAAFGDLDVVPEVVEGIVEAELSFTGATGGLRAAAVPGPYVVVDLGGGSTELVRGTTHVEAAFSMDIGSVRMTERHLHDDPPTADQVAAARADVRAALDVAEREVRLDGVGAVVGLAGSITTITAHALGLARYDPEASHLARITGGRAPRGVPLVARDEQGAAGGARLHAPWAGRRHRGRGPRVARGARPGAGALARGGRRDLGARHPRRGHPVAGLRLGASPSRCRSDQ